MPTTAEKVKLRSKLHDFEGTIPHMYLDSKGYVTVELVILLVPLPKLKN